MKPERKEEGHLDNACSAAYLDNDICVLSMYMDNAPSLSIVHGE